MYKRHFHNQKCKHCKNTLAYDLITIGCNTKVVFFLSCEICNTENVLTFSDGTPSEDPNQIRLFKNEEV